MSFSRLKSFMARIALKRKCSLPSIVYKTTYDLANASRVSPIAPFSSL